MKWLNLPPDVAPKIRQYRDAERELDLASSHKDIIEAYELWSAAQSAITGGRVPETPPQRALRRATSGRRCRRNHEAYLAGVGLWLDKGSAAQAETDYDHFVDGHNDRIADDALPLVKSELWSCNSRC